MPGAALHQLLAEPEDLGDGINASHETAFIEAVCTIHESMAAMSIALAANTYARPLLRARSHSAIESPPAVRFGSRPCKNAAAGRSATG
jgi:hypothetical protein